LKKRSFTCSKGKNFFQNSLIGGEEGFVKNLTMKDLEYLLK